MDRRRLKAVVIKEFYQVFRDPSSIMIAFVFPMILLIVYGFGVSLDANLERIALVLEDTSPDARSFAEALTNSPYFRVKVVRDRREVMHDLVVGNIHGIVVVPSYFTQYKNSGHHIAPIQVIADGSEPNTASFIQNYVQGAWSNWLDIEAIQGRPVVLPLVRAQPRFWFNQELSSRNFLIPSSLALIIALIGTMLTALVVAREWERGTMEALMATPIHISEVLIGKLIPYFCLGMGSMTACVIVATAFYQVPFRGSFFALTLVSATFLLAALGQGLLISSLSRNQFVAAQAALISAFLPAFMLSGFIFEISSMPWILQIVTHFIAATYFIAALKTLFLAGDVWALLIPNTLAILAIAALFFAITARNTVKRLE